MAKEKACKECKRIIKKGKTCPNCGSKEFSKNWKGMVYIFDPKNSKIAQEMEIDTPGKYALRVS